MPMPSSYSMDNHQRIVRAMQGGATIEAAGEYVGVSGRTVYRWFQRGRETLERWEVEDADEATRAADPDWTWAQFALDVDAARGRVLVNAAAIVTSAAFGREAEYDDAGNLLRAEVPPDARMALELLARRDPENWGRTMKPSEAFLRHHVTGAKDEDLSDLLAAGEELLAELASRA